MNPVETSLDGGASRTRPARGHTALVLCGGGSHGALEVGFARALSDLGIRYDQILGTSIGAVNGAFLAGGMSTDELAVLWRNARLRQLLRPNWNWMLHPRSRPGLLSLGAFGRLLERMLPVRRFEDLRIPLTVVTTDLITGKACYWEGSCDIIAPILASVSLPGVFPPAYIDGHPHIDGGLSAAHASTPDPRVWTGVGDFRACAADSQCKSMLVFCGPDPVDQLQRTHAPTRPPFGSGHAG